MTRLLRLAALVLVIAVASLPARAEDLTAAVAALGGEGFAAKEQAIVALGKTGDPRAVPILQALGDNRLRKAPDARIVLLAPGRGTARMNDAATGAALGDVAVDSLDRIIVNNRLRGVIEAALGALTLFSPDRAARLAAAQDVPRHPSAGAGGLLEKALAAEADGEIQAALQRRLAPVHL